MDQEREFLKMLDANPDDRLTRQVYSDWLEEQGDPRGTLLRLVADHWGPERKFPVTLEILDEYARLQQQIDDEAWMKRLRLPFVKQ